MRLSTIRMGAAALVLLGLVSATQAQVRIKDDKLVYNSLLLKLLQLQKLLPDLSSKSCDSESAAPCIIEMKLIQVDGRKYCLAVAPDLTVKWNLFGGIFNKKIIRWKLSAPDLDSKPLAFHADSGIVVAFDPDAQLDKHGDYGDGGIARSADTYFTRTKRNKQDATSSYLPVILWGSGGNEELCAAVDPKIVNVN